MLFPGVLALTAHSRRRKYAPRHLCIFSNLQCISKECIFGGKEWRRNAERAPKSRTPKSHPVSRSSRISPEEGRLLSAARLSAARLTLDRAQRKLCIGKS